MATKGLLRRDNKVYKIDYANSIFQSITMQKITFI